MATSFETCVVTTIKRLNESQVFKVYINVSIPIRYAVILQLNHVNFLFCLALKRENTERERERERERGVIVTPDQPRPALIV